MRKKTCFFRKKHKCFFRIASLITFHCKIYHILHFIARYIIYCIPLQVISYIAFHCKIYHALLSIARYNMYCIPLQDIYIYYIPLQDISYIAFLNVKVFIIVIDSTQSSLSFNYFMPRFLILIFNPAVRVLKQVSQIKNKGGEYSLDWKF